MTYATGLGLTAGESGSVAEEVEAYLGDREAAVTYAHRANGFPGLYRIDVVAPVLATDRLYLRTGGWQSNITEIGIQSGTNVSNVTASIDSIYPSSDPSAGMGTTFALMLHVGTFSASFDVAPSAGPFDVAAVGEAGATIISFNPTAHARMTLG